MASVMTDAGRVSSSDHGSPDECPPTAGVAVHQPDGCLCGLDRPRGMAGIGLPSGVDAAPILADPPGTRHLARRGRDGRYRTLCGRLVPCDHRCPTDDELRAAKVWTMLSCGGCHHVWLNG